MDRAISRRDALKVIAAIPSLYSLPGLCSLQGAEVRDRISLSRAVVVVESQQPSYLEHAVHEFVSYVSEISGSPVIVDQRVREGADCTIFVGGQFAKHGGATVSVELGEEGFVLQALSDERGKNRIIVAGTNPKGTRQGLIALMRMIRSEGTVPFVDAHLKVQSEPHFHVRGLHLNGWPFSYPYSFRTWPEKDWKNFIDIAALQGVNLLFLWPFMEIMPVPLSHEDETYLQEVRRVVEYAHKSHGMEMWIMHSANRIGISRCDSDDPRTRPYWVPQCQSDMNPADPAQYERLVNSLEALYRIVNNADGFGMIDSDPGGWPQSPLNEQMKIFAEARRLLDKYNENGPKAKLVDWMWFGWGRHKYSNSNRTVVAEYDWNGPDASDIAFMEKTIQGFRETLHEPWWLIAGYPPYLQSTLHEGVLNKTIFMPYGAIEREPSFPMTNISLEPVRDALDVLGQYPNAAGIMGNNMTPLIQLPLTYYLLASAWNYDYRNKNEEGVLHDLAGQLYPDNQELVASAYLSLQTTDVHEIATILSRLEDLAAKGAAGRPGVLGRKLFPTPMQNIHDLISQLKIRKAQQALLVAAFSKVSTSECSEFVEDYLNELLAWSHETGWEKMIAIEIWRQPIYPSKDKNLVHAMSGLKRIITTGSSSESTYDRIANFFAPIGIRLSRKYGSNAAMISCVEPMKLAVLQAAS